jgi:hypothetical protein
MVMLFALASCSSKLAVLEPPSDNQAGFTMPGCKQIQEKDRVELERLAASHFKSEIGVTVVEFKLLSGIECDKKFVIPIQALIKEGPFPRVWFVEIDKFNKNIISLMRPW